MTFRPLPSLNSMTSNSRLRPLHPVNQAMVSESISSAKKEPCKSMSWVLASVMVSSLVPLELFDGERDLFGHQVVAADVEVRGRPLRGPRVGEGPPPELCAGHVVHDE